MMPSTLMSWPRAPSSWRGWRTRICRWANSPIRTREAPSSSDVRTDESRDVPVSVLFLATGRERAKIQQLAYAGLRKRSELAKVTLMT